MPTSAMIAGKWQTTVVCQCRNEPPFKAVVRFQHIPGRGLTAYINCPHCSRGYYLGNDGKWEADRPLKIIEGG